MSIRKTTFVSGEYYHIYNRGNSKQKIFLDDNDRDHFVKLLYLCNSTRKINFREDIVKKKIDAWDFDRGDRIVSIGSWVLMPNHFHLYLTLNSNSPHARDGGKDNERYNSLSLFMGRISNAYAKYFNKKYGRSGTLFEGKFKSVHVDNDVQAKYLFSYINLNPIKLIQSDWKEKGINDSKLAINFLDSYKWSSYLDFCEIKRRENLLLNIEDFPDYFSTKEKFKKEILEWIKSKED